MFDVVKLKKNKWAQQLKTYAFLRNTEFHDAIKATPFEIYHGRKVNTQIPSDIRPNDQSKDGNSRLRKVES